MALGYKYVERTADSQLNWAEIGKNMSDTFAEVNRVREEKKATYDEATRMFENQLYETPQGKDENANNFTNNFAHDMIEQTRLDEKLFKSGQMSERQYTLKRQNALDGTKQLYEIQKLYQAEFAKKMEGITSGKLQSLNIFNMKMVEGYGDFNNSKATINPLDNRVGIGLVETKIINGKPVKVVSKNIADVNVIRGKIGQNVETLDTDSETSRIVKGFGTKKDNLYQAATLNNAGTITEYLGPTFLGTLKDPTDIKIVNDMNKAIKDQINSVLSNPYNFTSVLTENTGNYDENSFTFDIDEARKDKSKILVKVDPTTSMTIPDTKGPNYKAQYQEAEDWMRTDILRKIDEERTIKTTAQNQLQETAMARAQAEAANRPKTPEENEQIAIEKDAENFATNEAYLLTGTDAQKNQALAYFRGRGADIRSNPKGKPPGNYIMTANGLVAFESKGDVNAAASGITGALLKATGATIPEDMIVNKTKGKIKGKKFNTSLSGTGATVDTEAVVSQKINQVGNPSLYQYKNSQETADFIIGVIGGIPGIKVVPQGGLRFGGNKITITKPGAPPLILNSNEDSKVAKNMAKDAKLWLEKNLTDDEKLVLSGEMDASELEGATTEEVNYGTK